MCNSGIKVSVIGCGEIKQFRQGWYGVIGLMWGEKGGKLQGDRGNLGVKNWKLLELKGFYIILFDFFFCIFVRNKGI